jgi:hypothetical protein
MKHCYELFSIHTAQQVKAMPQLRGLVARMLPQRPGFDPRSVHVRFLVDKVALGQIFVHGLIGFAVVKMHITNWHIKRNDQDFYYGGPLHVQQVIQYRKK